MSNETFHIFEQATARPEEFSNRNSIPKSGVMFPVIVFCLEPEALEWEKTTGNPWVKEPRDEDAGYDVRVKGNFVIPAYGQARMPTGIKSAFLPNYVAEIKDRSSMAVKGLSVIGGVVDSGYRGEWSVILVNHTGSEIDINFGDKIAQVVFVNISKPHIYYVDKVSDMAPSVRGDRGFGSTGK